MDTRHRLRSAGNWVNLSTPFGLVVARLGSARTSAGPRGTYLAEGYQLPFPVAGAFTVGNVIISARPRHELDATLLGHEERHCWQWFGLLGVFFLPAYGLAMLWSWARTGDRAAGNAFEVDAGLAAGGYREHPRRPWREALAETRTLLRRRGR